MRAADWPRYPRARHRLLCVDPAAAPFDAVVEELPALLSPGDVVVVNDAATLPASLAASAQGGAVEVRLVALGPDGTWRAVLLGAGDWRTPTEHRPPPPELRVGERLGVGDLRAEVVARSPLSPRLVDLRFDRSGAALWAALYAHGRPVQYAHVRDDLPLWAVQTVYAGRPWAVEPPSAGWALSWGVLSALRARGVAVRPLTHAAGLTATGDEAIDGALPFPERYDLPARTVATIAAARRAGGRVIAIGTTVVRALEGCAASHGALRPGEGVTDLVIRAGFRPQVVDGVLTGMHEPGTSHRTLQEAFAPPERLAAAWDHAVTAGYLGHELGDATLILPGLAALARAA